MFKCNSIARSKSARDWVPDFNPASISAISFECGMVFPFVDGTPSQTAIDMGVNYVQPSRPNLTQDKASERTPDKLEAVCAN